MYEIVSPNYKFPLVRTVLIPLKNLNNNNNS